MAAIADNALIVQSDASVLLEVHSPRFFTLVSRDTREEEFAHHRKLFLTEQGYSYQVRLLGGS